MRICDYVIFFVMEIYLIIEFIWRFVLMINLFCGKGGMGVYLRIIVIIIG